MTLPVFQETVSWSSVASADLPLTTQNAISYLIIGAITDVSTDGGRMRGQLTNDAFATVESGAVYDWGHWGMVPTSTEFFDSTDNVPETSWYMSNAIGAAAGEMMNFQLRIMKPHVTARPTMMSLRTAGLNASGNIFNQIINGRYQTAEDNDGLRIFMDSGTFDGLAHIWGLTT